MRRIFEDLIDAGISLIKHIHSLKGIVISGLFKFLKPVAIVGKVIVAWEGQLTAIPDQNTQGKKNL